MWSDCPLMEQLDILSRDSPIHGGSLCSPSTHWKFLILSLEACCSIQSFDGFALCVWTYVLLVLWKYDHFCHLEKVVGLGLATYQVVFRQFPPWWVSLEVTWKCILFPKRTGVMPAWQVFILSFYFIASLESENNNPSNV